MFVVDYLRTNNRCDQWPVPLNTKQVKVNPPSPHCYSFLCPVVEASHVTFVADLWGHRPHGFMMKCSTTFLFTF